MIVWVIAGLLALATGTRIGWALVNRQSIVTGAMILALGSLAVLAALNWPPLTRLVDGALGRPNIAVGLSQVALICSAAGSCVMITSVSAGRPIAQTRRLAFAQYSLAAAVAVFTMSLFLTAEPQPEMTPGEYLAVNLDARAVWLAPLLYVALGMAVASWVGMRLSDDTRRGRALLVFSLGTALIVLTAAALLLRLAGSGPLAGARIGATLLLCALTVVAVGSLLPSIEDWAGSRREMRVIDPLLREMERRHPDVGIGVRPRGPLVFRVAERLSSISDALYLEAAGDREVDERAPTPDADAVGPVEQARAIARWIQVGPPAAEFPGAAWLRQPQGYSDRDWILEIARQYRDLVSAEPPDQRVA